MSKSNSTLQIRAIALIPAYKPNSVLIDTIQKLCDNDFIVVVVDDGSGDEYETIFKDASSHAKLIVHDKNKGKGAALKTGMQYIRESIDPSYIVVTVDADGQHMIYDIISVYEAASELPDALILGSRSLGKDVPLRSRIGNGITWSLYRIFYGTKVRDTQTGLRAFSDKLLPTMLAITGERYEYEMNVLIEMDRQNIPIKEVPIESVYFDNNSSSHFRTVRDSLRIYKEMLRYSVSSLISFIVDYGLFCILNYCTNSLVFSNITARILSATLNFNINKKYVFRSKQKLVTSTVRYIALAITVMLLNTVLLKALSLIGINSYVAKIMANVILFVFSYVLQHSFVFKEGHASKQNTSE